MSEARKTGGQNKVLAPTSATSAVVVQRKRAKKSVAIGTSTPGIPEMDAGRVRVVIDALFPEVDGGRFCAKWISGMPVRIEAHCFADGHDQLRVVLNWNAVDQAHTKAVMHEVEMTARGNDVWTAEFTPPTPGRYRCIVTAWVDQFESWRKELERRDDLVDVRDALQVGAKLIDIALIKAANKDVSPLTQWANELREAANGGDVDVMKLLAFDSACADILVRYAERRFPATKAMELIVDRKRAAFSSWYELFPRSASDEAGRHGTFNDVEARLPYIAELGFDVLYFPPIHPIGRVFRKGKNNKQTAESGDVGSPWAIGAEEGGHKDILPALGSMDDFCRLHAKAESFGIEIALDIAFQCAPDHPYVKSHPQWFRHRLDGSVQYAENPPKKYQDIYPFDFECEDWRALWAELKSVVDFWISHGVKIFRVDNPHTKPFVFWEWLINEVKREHPEVIFLAEAFARPKVMHRLAKLGFTQSYTYFTWRNNKQELVEYFTELTALPGCDYFRPNVWPSTPDILHAALHSGNRALFESRLVLAATLAANYGIYGPAYELMENTPREAGNEEFLNSEKYQLRHWDLDRPDSLRSFIARINYIRRSNPALQSDDGLRFCPVNNDHLIAYVKCDDAHDNIVLTVVNLDAYNLQSGWVELDIAWLKLEVGQQFQVHDLLSDQRYLWQGSHNYVLLDPQRSPAHVFRLRRHVRSENDFDYYD